MTRLAEPTIDDQMLIDSVVAQRQNGKNAKFFNSIHAEWKTRAIEYITNGGNPELLVPWEAAAAQSGALENLYSAAKEGDAQKPVLDALRERTLQLCPFCGEDGTPNTLDHFLPKSKYPEFALLSRNLLPMCDICQLDKGTKTVSTENLRIFMHPYFDAFATTQLVDLVIGLPFNAPKTIGLTPNPHLTVDQAELVSRHLQELRILERYYHFFRSEYRRLLRLVAVVRAEQQNVPNALERFRFYAGLKSTNSWGHVFYTGVLSTPGLSTFLEIGVLPPLP